MLARYLEYLDGTADAAVVRRVAGGESHANDRGRALLRAGAVAFETCFAQAADSGETALCIVDDVQLAFVPLFDEHGRPDAVLATSAPFAELPRVLHQLHSTMRHFAQIVHLLPQIILTARPNGRIDYTSRRWSEVALAGRSAGEPHASVFGAFEETHGRAIEEQWQSGIAGGSEFGFEVNVRTGSGLRWHALRATPWNLHGAIVKWAVSLTDVDTEVRARTALERSRCRLHLLADVGRALNGAIDPAVIAGEVVRSLAWWSGGTAIVELRADGERVALHAQPADGQLLVERIAAAFARGESAQSEIPGLQAAPVRGIGARVCGFLAVVRPEWPEPDEDRHVLEEVASRVAVAFERALEFGREHRIADALQRAMLPVALPLIPGVVFDVAYTPAGKDILVGGDWYDSFLLQDERIAVVIGDVAGHGLEAAIVMANLRRTIRAAAFNEHDPADILARANVVALSERCPMVTVFLGILDPLTLGLDYASAGHPPPIIVHRDGELQALEADGPPLGVAQTLSLTTRTAALTEGSALVMYTDGVVEARRDSDGGEFALRDALRVWSSHRFAETAEVLQGRVIGDVASDDDAAMLVVRLVGPDELSLTFAATSAASHRARSAVQRYVGATAMGVERAFDFALAVAEAMNNAAEHAYGGTEGTVSLRLWEEGGDLIATVEDRGRWRLGSRPDRGRGLMMMEKLVDAFEVRRIESGTTVILSMRLPAGAAASRFA